ncbi:MAG: hypothetical protein NT079_03220, partial [Candidatus Omnitrophica bacterium]|nr:hypothetical protein [Candidatus Omnitrophota bacterium]
MRNSDVTFADSGVAFSITGAEIGDGFEDSSFGKLDASRSFRNVEIDQQKKFDYDKNGNAILYSGVHVSKGLYSGALTGSDGAIAIDKKGN